MNIFKFLFLIVYFAVLYIGWLITGGTLFLLIALLSAAALAVSAILFLLFDKKVYISLTCEQVRTEVGKTVKIYLLLKNKGPAFISNASAKLKIKHCYKGEKELTVNVPISPFLNKRIVLPIVCESAGEISISAEELFLTDMTGIFKFKRKSDAYCRFSVMPAYIDITLPEQAESDINITAPIYSKSSAEGDVSGSREYIFGDRLNRVNWKQSARAGKLMVREYERDLSEEYVAVVDTFLGTIEKALDELFSLCYELIKRGEGIYVVYLPENSEQLEYHYITARDELNDTFDKLYTAGVQPSQGTVKDVFERVHGNCEVTYLPYVE